MIYLTSLAFARAFSSRKRSVLASLLPMALAAFSVSPLRAGTTLFTESFQNATAPGWTFVGNASLTSGTADPTGQGWLRLTNNNYNQSSFVYETRDLAFLHGVDIKINFAVWGGSGADGFAVDLINGSQNIIAPGGYGGSLGYAQRTGSTAANGLLGGILGLGVDEFGNFSNPSEGRVGGPGQTPNAVAIRGPGDGTTNATSASGQPNYAYLAGSVIPAGIQTGANGTTTRPANYYTADFQINTQDASSGTLPVVITLTDTNGTVTTISYDAYNALVDFYGGVANLPQTMDLGFSAGTGAQKNYHDVRDLVITSIEPLTTPEPVSVELILFGSALVLCGSTWGRRMYRNLRGQSVKVVS